MNRFFEGFMKKAETASKSDIAKSGLKGAALGAAAATPGALIFAGYDKLFGGDSIRRAALPLIATIAGAGALQGGYLKYKEGRPENAARDYAAGAASFAAPMAALNTYDAAASNAANSAKRVISPGLKARVGRAPRFKIRSKTRAGLAGAGVGGILGLILEALNKREEAKGK